MKTTAIFTMVAIVEVERNEKNSAHCWNIWFTGFADRGMSERRGLLLFINRGKQGHSTMLVTKMEKTEYRTGGELAFGLFMFISIKILFKYKGLSEVVQHQWGL